MSVYAKIIDGETYMRYRHSYTAHRQGQNNTHTNEMTSAIEVYELNRDKPEKFSAYISSDMKHLTTWTGDIIGTIVNIGPSFKLRAFDEAWNTYRVRTMWGDTYTGRSQGSGMYINLRRIGG